MLSQVNVASDRGDLLQLVLADNTEGFALEDVGGLGPVKATLVSTGFANQDGVQPQASKREQRDMSLKIELVPQDYTVTVADLRQRLYDFFMTKSWVTLEFINPFSDPDIAPIIRGQVESCEPDMFTIEPMMNVNITCFDPDFVDPDVVTVSGNTTSGTTPDVVSYVGSIETGVLFSLNVNRSINDFVIYNQPQGADQQELEFSAALLAGDVLTISTVPGNKYVTLTRGGVDFDLLYGMSPQSGWIELKKGANQFMVYTSGAAIPWTMSYTTKYGGM